MSLYIYVIDPVLREKFKQHLANHRFTDSGFDLLCPKMHLGFPTGGIYGVEMKLGVKCASLSESGMPTPYLLLARSSTSLTPLRMSNQIGLADMGYRGELIARVDNVGHSVFGPGYNIEEGRRLFQIVQHNWLPWNYIYIVDTEDELPSAPDSRGEGGFGSTGLNHISNDPK